MNEKLICPMDFVKVNENQARLNALQVLSLTVAWLITGWLVIPVFLVADFFLRSFDLGKFSILNQISGWGIRYFSLPVKLVDRAPKRFAAYVGLVFSFSIAVLGGLGWQNSAIFLSGTLALCAALEAFAGFCAGCYVHTWMSKMRSRINPL